ncbi:hypothetical protein ACHAXS_006482 [Conticribra weissflogii]
MKHHRSAIILASSSLIFQIGDNNRLNYNLFCYAFTSITPRKPLDSSKERSRQFSPLLPNSFERGEGHCFEYVASSSTNDKPTKPLQNQKRPEKQKQLSPPKIQLNSRQKSISRGRDPIISLNMNLDYLAKSNQKNAAFRAEELLLRIEALHEDGYYEKSPDVCSYNCVINAFCLDSSEYGYDGSGMRGELAMSTVRGYNSKVNEGTLEEDATYDKVLSGGTTYNAERLIRRMIQKGLMPNEITYNTLLRCISKDMDLIERGNFQMKNRNVKNKIKTKNKPSSSVSTRTAQTYQEILIHKAETILSKMEDLKIANTITYNTMISILSKRQQPTSRSKNNRQDKNIENNNHNQVEEPVRQAEACFHRMLSLYTTTSDERIQPDTCSFNSLIGAYAKIGASVPGAKDRAIRAEELLRQMEDLYRENPEGNEKVKPDVISYSSVVSAYAKASRWGEEECALKAFEILKRMEELYEGGEDNVKPNKRTYTAVINAFARTGQPESAEMILSNMKRSYDLSGDMSLKPDTICFTSIIDAYAKKGGEEAAERAEDLLHEMENLYNMGDKDVKPNTRTYSAVITALGKSGLPRAAEKAEQILDEMVYISSYGSKDLAPNTILYNAVIDAYARSPSIGKCNRAELLLERMIEESDNGNTAIRPDTITFNTVINAAARSSIGDHDDRKEAYLIGLNAFKSLHRSDYCQPSSITYILFLRVLENLMESEETRDYMAGRVFELCQKHNLVNEAVLSQLKKTCSHDVFRSLVSSKSTD